VLVVMPALLAGLPLLLIGQFTPPLMLTLTLALELAVVPYAWRLIPAPPDAGREPAPWWAVAGVVAVALVFCAFQLAYHSQFIITGRDPGGYVQFAVWIANHHSLPVPQDNAAFGGTYPWLRFDSIMTFQVGHTVVPQAMAGLPMLLGCGYWAGGLNAVLWMAPVLGAGGLLVFGGAVARLVGPRWAPLGTLVLAVSLPEEFTSRSDYSEPLAQIVFLGGICLLLDGLRTGGRTGRLLAGLAGLAFGLTLLVRIDGPSDTLPLIPFCCLLMLTGRREGAPLLGGFIAGSLYGVTDGLVLARPYVQHLTSSVKLMTLAVLLSVAATALVVMLPWRHAVARLRAGWLPDAAMVLPFAALAIFAIRPLLMKHRLPEVQYGQLLVLHWVTWYVGLPVVVLGAVAAALLLRRCLRGQAPSWSFPLASFGWATFVCLYRPAIYPDQPWGSRRLVPVVLPGFVLLATWACAYLAARLRRVGYAGVPVTGLAACCTLVALLPPAMTTFGLGLDTSGGHGPRVIAKGVAFKVMYGGEVGVVNRVCDAIGKDASVVIVAPNAALFLPQPIRGMCGVPAAAMTNPQPSQVADVMRGIERAGRTPVFLGAKQSDFSGYGRGAARQVGLFRIWKDGATTFGPPATAGHMVLNLWTWRPAR
jgi:hypothetical protein